MNKHFALQVAVDLATKIGCFKRLFTPSQWDERMRMVRPVIEGRMKIDGTDPLSAAVDLAKEMTGDSACHDMLPLLILAGGVELQRQLRTTP